MYLEIAFNDVPNNTHALEDVGAHVLVYVFEHVSTYLKQLWL